MRNNLTQTIGEGGNEEEQKIQTININNRTDNRSEMMWLMLTMTMLMRFLSSSSNCVCASCINNDDIHGIRKGNLLTTNHSRE